MLFQNSIIQNKVKSFFEQVINNNRLAHAYLFYGKQGTGKTAFAVELAKTLNCESENKPCGQCPACVKIEKSSHPDVKLVLPVSKSTREENYRTIIKQKTLFPFKKLPVSGHLNIPIESIRALKKEAMYAPYEAKKRFFIIAGIEYFSREAANSFLKLLEEPPERLQIILITEDINSVMETIRSRCQPVMFPVFEANQIRAIVEPFNKEDADLTTLIRINQNNVEKIIDQLENKGEDLRPFVTQFLRAAATTNWLEINTVIEHISQKRDKNLALEFLNILILWLSDAFHLLYMENDAMIANSDMHDTIHKFAMHYTQMDYEQLSGLIEQACSDIRSNLNVNLTFTNLAINIKNLLTFRKSA